MYRIQVAENSMPTDGKFVEIVGHYNPTSTDQPLEVKKERVEYWIKQGAQPSDTVAKLLNKVGFSLLVEQKNKSPKKKAKAKSEAAMSSGSAGQPQHSQGGQVSKPESFPVDDQNPQDDKDTIETEESTAAEEKIDEKAEDSVVEQVETIETPQNDEADVSAEQEAGSSQE